MTARTRQNIRLGVIAATVVILLVLFLQNTGQVTVKILFQSFSMPLVALLILIAVVSFVMGFVVHSLLARKRRAQDQANA